MIARIVNLALLTAVVIAIPLSHFALSKPGMKSVRVAICHFSDDDDDAGTERTGRVLRVSENAVAMHIAKHGDCKDFTTDATGYCTCPTCTELCDAALQRCLADCSHSVSPNGTCQLECDKEFQQCLKGCVKPAAG